MKLFICFLFIIQFAVHAAPQASTVAIISTAFVEYPLVTNPPTTLAPTTITTLAPKSSSNSNLSGSKTSKERKQNSKSNATKPHSKFVLGMNWIYDISIIKP
ncbi:hypothetical protein PVAND_016812 [Polypedilum vanderplanki]|uniref:Uncharacterized protein n=1 Tax=Polypedilum vanderplanki TaxID=319348 RepID=A0A9J6BGH8_POLVA|nr:hypothetical protein PVAND_016812 [Polypedilum vanderplanki]